MKKDIHECEITIHERLLSIALDAHFSGRDCTGYLYSVGGPVFINSSLLSPRSWNQLFKCEHCKKSIIAVCSYEKTD